VKQRTGLVKESISSRDNNPNIGSAPAAAIGTGSRDLYTSFPALCHAAMVDKSTLHRIANPNHGPNTSKHTTCLHPQFTVTVITNLHFAESKTLPVLHPAPAPPLHPKI